MMKHNDSTNKIWQDSKGISFICIISSGLYHDKPEAKTLSKK